MKKIRILSLLMAAVMLTACSPAPGSSEETASAPEQTVVASDADVVSGSDAVSDADLTMGLPEIEAAVAGQAGGNIVFHINGTPVHAGAAMKTALTDEVRTPDDLDQMIQPGHFSLPIQLRYPISGEDDGLLYAIVMNPTDKALPVRDCLIYSLSAANRDGMEVGAEHFCLGTSSPDDIISAYGEPTQRVEATNYNMLVYYSPLDCSTFLFRKDVLKQVSAYHIAQLYQKEIEETSDILTGDFSSRNGFLLLSRYLDVAPYIAGEQGSVRELDTVVTVSGSDITLGCHSQDLPEPWASKYIVLTAPIGPGRIMRVGLANSPEFAFYNSGDQNSQLLKGALAMEVYLMNPSADNLGEDLSGYPTFEYMGISNDDDITKILDTLGAPVNINTTCDGGHSFAWLEYAAENGDKANFRVDVFTGEIIELQVIKYDENAKPY